MPTPPAMRLWGWGLRRRLDRGPCGAPWVSGALQLRHDPLRVLMEAAHCGGEVVALGRWPRPLYLVNHPTLIQSILEQPAHYTKRPSITRITPLFGAGLTTSAPTWRRRQLERDATMRAMAMK